MDELIKALSGMPAETVKVKVTGMGGCISNQMHIIQKALEDAGYRVEVIDRHPNPVVADLMKPQKRFTKIVLEAEHCEWGG